MKRAILMSANEELKTDWYRIRNIDKIDSPALVIYPERVSKNISTLISMIDDVSRLRPHVKTHKSAEATRLLMNAGIRKFKCATIAEAEMLGMVGAQDVLLAYQPAGPKLNRFIQVIKKFPVTRFSCLIDNAVSAENIALAAAKKDLVIPVYLDLNVGMNRTGIKPGEKAIELYKQCATIKGIRIMGLHAYDGHLHNPDFAERKYECDQAFEPVLAMRNLLLKEGFAEPMIIAGGSPTFPIHAKREQIECSPGTFIYWDEGYRRICAEQDFIPAALVICRVISIPSENLLCVDLGHKSISAENSLDKRVYFLNASELKPISQSEEHLMLDARAGHTYQIGDVLYGLPFHICPTVALYERAIIIENNESAGEWFISRDRKISI